MEKINLAENARLIRNQALFTSEIDEDLVMMDDVQGLYFNLNPMGKHVWELLTVPKAYNEVIASLTAVYDISKEECRKDVEPFLCSLIENNLIQIEKEFSHE